MGGSLTQQRRVREEGPLDRKPLSAGTKLPRLIAYGVTVLTEEGPANYVPAAAVIRRGRALSGIIGRKERVGGLVGLALKPTAQLWNRVGNHLARVRKRSVEFLV